MAQVELCTICDEPLDRENEVVKRVWEKDIAIFVAKSKRRNDNKWKLWRGKSSIEFHDLCRKEYKTLTKNYQPAESSESSDEDMLSDESSSDFFDFTKYCFLCGGDLQSEMTRAVNNDNMADRFMSLADLREDKLGEEVLQRLENAPSLTEVNARYHGSCYKRFVNIPLREKPDQKSNENIIFNEICDYIEKNHEKESPFTLTTFKKVVNGKSFSYRNLYKQLVIKYKEDIYISQHKDEETKIYYKNLDKILPKGQYLCPQSLTQEQKYLLVKTAAQILRSRIIAYNDGNKSATNATDEIPPVLTDFLNKLIPTGKNGKSINICKRDSIAHSIMSIIQPSTFKSNLQSTVGTYVYQKTGSEQIVDLLSRLGVCPSYNNLQTVIENSSETAVENDVKSIVNKKDHQVDP